MRRPLYRHHQRNRWLRLQRGSVTALEMTGAAKPGAGQNLGACALRAPTWQYNTTS
jgi:hypothetical protein